MYKVAVMRVSYAVNWSKPTQVMTW